MEVVRCAVCVVGCVLTWVSVNGQSVVNTYYGALQGVRVTLSPDLYVDKFLNIPYARPPLGGLRFSVPQAPDVWSGVRDATRFGNMCPQPKDALLLPSQVFPQSEDCLYLNVYRPKVTDAMSNLPVMVWIHGGGFVMGSGNRFDWTQLATHGVVVVTINYRLGALGFLSTADGAIPGNYGLYDQIRALEWVRDVIADFNGDPHNVTIFGESAGSMSVSLLIESRAAVGLFHKAIMESGASLTPGGMSYLSSSPGPRQQALQLASALGCDSIDTSRLVDCLRTKDTFAILNASLTQNLGFVPVPETTFGQYGLFVATPEVIMRNNWFANVPTIRGFNEAEFAISLPDDNTGFSREEVQRRVQEMANHYFTHATFQVDAAAAVQEIMIAYFSDLTDSAAIRDAFIQLSTDFRFIAPTILEVELATAHDIKPQFVYRFSYRSKNRLNPPWKKAQHVDEIPYVSGAPVAGIQAIPNFVSSWTDDDRRISTDLMTMWSNFAKYGNPTPTAVDGTKWVPWTQSDHLLEIGTTLRMHSQSVTSQQKMFMRILSQMYSGRADLSPLLG